MREERKILMVTTAQLREGYVERLPDGTLRKNTYTVIKNMGDRHIVEDPRGEVVK